MRALSSVTCAPAALFRCTNRLSSGASFWLIDTDDERAAVVDYPDATLEFPDDLQFVSLDVSHGGDAASLARDFRV